MKRLLVTLILALLPTALSAQTLGQATMEVRDRTEALISQRLPQVDSWGEQTALDDLRLVHQSSAALYEALAGTDATAVKTYQQNLATAARRLKTSHSLLPDAAADAATVAELDSQVAAIDARLTELRLRFGQKATLTPGPLAGESLSPSDPAFDLYINPQALLIDVRDARRLASSLQVGHYPGYGFGFGQPNNLDSLQVRRLVLKAWALENALQGQYSDISEVMDEWVDFRREYDRLGYPGSNQVVRQLDRVMDRLSAFFGDVASQ
jgi:hypothetical protein